MNVPTSVISMRMNPSAEPYGQSRPSRNSSWTTLAIVVVLAPPSRSGVTKSPIAGMNVRIAAAMIPGIVSGSVTWRNACRPLAYRSRAAPTRAGSSRSIETYSGRIANGRKP